MMMTTPAIRYRSDMRESNIWPNQLADAPKLIKTVEKPAINSREWSRTLPNTFGFSSVFRSSTLAPETSEM